MRSAKPIKIALLWHEEREPRTDLDAEGHRFGPAAGAMREEGLEVCGVTFEDRRAEEVRHRLMDADGVQVWVNPIEGGGDRHVLNQLLAEVAGQGVHVSAHPDTISKMGTKEVLCSTRSMSWGSETLMYRTMEEMTNRLPTLLAKGRPRVLKQIRGHSGGGVWKVTPTGNLHDRVLARHAARGSVETELSLDQLFEQFAPYFERGGGMVDQPYQERLIDGMIRCYLVQDRVAGFGHQAVNALFPAREGCGADQAPQPGPRLYFPPSQPEFQDVKKRMEDEWLGEMMRILGVSRERLPLLWDADFFHGARGDAETYVLGEINVSSVYPFPDSALAPLAHAARQTLERSRAMRSGAGRE